MIVKFCIRILVFFLVGLIVLILGSYAFVSISSSKFIYTEINSMPKKEYALLPGTSRLMDNGDINLFFKNRCDAVVELWKSKKIDKIIISGDSANANYDEVAWMQQELIINGIPDSVITLDKFGYNTKASILYCKKHEIKDLIFVSQRFHNQRAIVLSKMMGINTLGYNAKPVYTSYGIRVMIREWFAKVKLIMELIVFKIA